MPIRPQARCCSLWRMSAWRGAHVDGLVSRADRRWMGRCRPASATGNAGWAILLAGNCYQDTVRPIEPPAAAVEGRARLHVSFYACRRTSFPTDEIRSSTRPHRRRLSTQSRTNPVHHRSPGDTFDDPYTQKLAFLAHLLSPRKKSLSLHKRRGVGVGGSGWGALDFTRVAVARPGVPTRGETSGPRAASEYVGALVVTTDAPALSSIVPQPAGDHS